MPIRDGTVAEPSIGRVVNGAPIGNPGLLGSFRAAFHLRQHAV